MDGLWCAGEWTAGRGGSQEARRALLGIGLVLLMATVRFITVLFSHVFLNYRHVSAGAVQSEYLGW